MIYRSHCLCLLAVLPVVCAASFRIPHSSAIHPRRKAHLRRSEEHGSHPVKRFHDLTRHGSHVWHYSSPDVHTSKFTELGGQDPSMVSAGKKEDEQREGVPVHSGVIPLLSQQSDSSETPSAAASLSTVVTSASTPVSSDINIGSTYVASSSSQSQSQSEGQATQSQRASSGLATASGGSSPSSAFSPALLAFILVPVCIFILGIAFAIYRIYGKPGNPVPPASPMFLGDATALGSGYHREEAMALNDPTMQSRYSILEYDVNKGGTIKWEPRVERNPSKSGASITRESNRNPRASHPRFRTHGAGTYNSPPSRVLRPHVSRPYNRPHPAFTADPESAIPLIVNGIKHKAYNNSEDEHTTPNSKGKGKGKEIVLHGRGHNARKHRDDISTTPLNTSPRSLPFRDPVISAVFSEVDVRFQARTLRSPSSLVSMTRDKNHPDVPSQSSTSTSFDIGLAMLTDFSSPNAGLGLDLSPCPPIQGHNSTGKISHTSESLGTGEKGNTSRDSAMPYLEHSVTAGSKGLAYLSGSSRETMFASQQFEAEPIEDELDIASALAVYKIQHAGDFLKAQKGPVDQMSETQCREIENQDSPVSSLSTETHYTPSDIKAPTLPTLSEMALSRADPLYESVTNELFSTYGMRMSTANGLGQKSRVSARISRMLSWFTGADSSNIDSRISGVENTMSCEDSKFSEEGHRERLSSMSSPGGVQPLRIGKRNHAA